MARLFFVVHEAPEVIVRLDRSSIPRALGVPPDSQARNELNLCAVFLVISSGGRLVERV